MNTTALNPRILQPGDIDPNWRWDKHVPAWGHTAVDFERRVDHDRLRRYRLSRSKDALKRSHCGSLLMFDVNNIRYVSGTKIGEWERDKMCRFCLLSGDEEPYVWDFGSFGMQWRHILSENRCVRLTLMRSWHWERHFRPIFW